MKATIGGGRHISVCFVLHNLEVLVLPQLDRDASNASVPESGRSHKMQKALSAASLVVLYLHIRVVLTRGSGF